MTFSIEVREKWLGTDIGRNFFDYADAAIDFLLRKVPG
uniref:Uncharacterized protein n=1 Tax=Anguilla anguilla TaxID=7936 RepID=A0A0E9T5Y2_ANGAN